MPSKKKKKNGGGKARKAGSSSKQKETQQGSLDVQMERLNIDGGEDNDSRANDEASLLEEAIKLAAAAAEKDALESRGSEKEESTETKIELIDSWKCLHGGFVPAEDRLFVVGFAETFLSGFNSQGGGDAGKCIDAAFKATEEKYPGAWGDISKLKLVRSFFLSYAAHLVLQGNIDIDGARSYAFVACFFDDYIANIHKLKAPSGGILNILEIRRADEHTLVKYLRKSIPCSCLDEKYKEVKSITRMGLCCNPQCSILFGVVERKSMLCCTGCHAANYCSRECQKADWPVHKKKCVLLRELTAGAVSFK